MLNKCLHIFDTSLILYSSAWRCNEWLRDNRDFFALYHIFLTHLNYVLIQHNVTVFVIPSIPIEITICLFWYSKECSLLCKTFSARRKIKVLHRFRATMLPVHARVDVARVLCSSLMELIKYSLGRADGKVRHIIIFWHATLCVVSAAAGRTWPLSRNQIRKWRKLR